MSQTVDMTTGKPASTMVRFAIPILLGSVIEMLYVTINGIVVGRFIGVNAFAAVGATFFIYWVVFCLELGLISAFGSVFTRRYGAKDIGGLNTAVAMSVWIVVVFGGVLSIGGILGANPILKLLDTPPEIMDDAQIYLQIRFAGMIIAFLSGTVNAIFYALGNSRIPFIAFVISSFVNIALCIMVVALTPWGVLGVALATIIAQLSSCLFCLFKIHHDKLLQLKKQDFRPDFPMLKELLAIGLPLGVRDLPAAIVGLIVLRQINGYGAAYTAGIAAAKQLNSILFPVGESLCSALSTFVGQNFGAKNYDRVLLGFRTAIKMLLVCVILIVIVMTPLRRVAISLFISGEGSVGADALQSGMRQLSLILMFLPTYYIAIAYRMYFKSIGNGFWPMISGFLEAAARLVVILALPRVIGEWSLYLAEVAGWPIMAIQLILVNRMYTGLKGKNVSNIEQTKP